MTTTAPARSDSLTNLRHEEAAWRASVCQVASSHVAIDVSTAVDPSEVAFTLHCRMRLRIRRLAEGPWVDFVGQGVDSLSIDGQPVAVSWDGARIILPVLDPGEHAVEIGARGLYSNSGQGLHRFHDPVDGATYLYTHFEPSDARRAWPVMEQPDLKTRFSLEVTHPRGWTVMSNTRPVMGGSGAHVPADSADTDSGQVGGDVEVTSFASSKPLPSYLTALAAGPWHRVTGQWSSPSRQGLTIPLSWSCRASLADHLDASELLDVTRAGLDLYDQSYSYGFPWDSYDSVLVPEYNLGAMENPGCVTFNEDLYLFRGPVTRAQRSGRANTILHEMCHMWFGDLVTPTWWEDTWLKESFADHQGTWAEAEAAGYTEAWVSFASTRKAWAYLEDSRPATTHPIVARVDDVEAARQAFDGITYAKGAAVLKQLVAWVGEDAFYEGARRYFDKHRFGATSLGDLLEALEEASHQELGSWKSAWLDTPGPSTLSASWETDPVGAITNFTLHQGGEACGGVLRPHRVTVSTWRAADGTLERTHVFDVRIDAENAPIDPEGVLAIPGGAAFVDLVVINDDDLTYAISRLDERSTDVALAYVGTINAPITRAVVWASLWNAVRDGLLDPRRFIASVLGAVPTETEPAVRDRLLLFVAEALSSFLPGSVRAESHDQALATTIRLAKESVASDADAWRAYTRAFIAEFAARGGDEYEAMVRGFAAVDNPDIAWRARRALAARGLVDEQTILAWRDADGSGEAARMAVEAIASLPEETTRSRAWASVMSDTLSNDYLSVTLAGLQASSWEGASGVIEAVARMREYWEKHTIGMALRYVSGVLDLSVDVTREGSVEASVTLLRSWLDTHEDAPAQLRRIVVEHLDDFERRERVQHRWEHDQ